MDKRHESKVVVVTGAAQGLGYAVARQMAADGAGIALVDMNGDKLKSAEEALKKEFPDLDIISIEADVSKEEDVQAYINKAKAHFGKINYLHNNAGIKGAQDKLAEYDSELFKHVLDVNLMSVFYGIRYAVPVMKEAGGGTIINTTSVFGILGTEGQAGYIASKHAVSGMTKNAAAEFAQDGINVLAIAPVGIKTEMLDRTLEGLNKENPEEAVEAFVKRNPSKRISTPEEVAGIVSSLFAEDARYINGQMIVIDGGTSAQY